MRRKQSCLETQVDGVVVVLSLILRWKYSTPIYSASASIAEGTCRNVYRLLCHPLMYLGVTSLLQSRRPTVCGWTSTMAMTGLAINRLKRSFIF